MPTKTHRPYLKDPRQFAFWKKAASPKGVGSEVVNYASPLARELWYYLRAIGYVKHPVGWKHDTHHHEDGFVVHVLLRGEMWHEINGRRFVARKGQACLLDLSKPVTYGVAGSRPVELHWALLTGRDMPRMFLELGADHDPVFRLLKPALVTGILRELQRLTTHEPVAYEAESCALLMMILAQLFASRAERLPVLSLGQAGRPLSDSVRKVVDYMTRHYDQQITLKHIATEVVSQNLSHLSRRFHQEVGISPVAYLNRFRIEQAKKSLASSNQPVGQVAKSVGFHNQQYFARMFLRIVGMTPLEYRKKPEKARRSH